MAVEAVGTKVEVTRPTLGGRRQFPITVVAWRPAKGPLGLGDARGLVKHAGVDHEIVDGSVGDGRWPFANRTADDVGRCRLAHAALAVMAYIVMAYTVMAYTVMSPGARSSRTRCAGSAAPSVYGLARA